MAGINFYGYNTCQTITESALFGVIDDGLGAPVRATEDASEKWGACIHNPQKKELLVLPVDKNVPVKKKDNTGNEEKLCDFLMRSYRSDGFLFFIELKEKRKSPLGDASKQLGSTIIRYKEYHNVELIQYKRAYITNGLHDRVNYSQANKLSAFRRTYGFVLFMTGEIEIPAFG